VIVIDSDDEVSRTWGQVAARGRRRGRPRPAIDSWGAASCLSCELPLATLNVKDYTEHAEHEGLILITE
jgi:predicted nucleic acid-binding protein